MQIRICVSLQKFKDTTQQMQDEQKQKQKQKKKDKEDDDDDVADY